MRLSALGWPRKDNEVKSKKSKPKQQWFARGGNIAKMGPFPSYARAAKALIMTDGRPIEGAFVWPETTQPEGKKNA